MPALSQSVLDGFQCRRHPIPTCLSYQHEPAATIFPTDMREPEEVERFRFTFSPAGAVFGSEAAELHQSGFLRVYRESELPQSALHGYTEALGIDSLVEPDDESSHPREPPPQVLTEPDVNLPAHPALPIEACPHSSGQCANSLVSLRATRASQ